MRTKKLIAIAVLAALGMSAQAQIVSSKSNQVVETRQPKEKKPKKPKMQQTLKWNLRLGYSFDNVTGGDYLSSGSGFDASFGISKAFGTNGLFWGVEAGAMTCGARLDKADTSLSSIGVDIVPRIGMQFILAQTIALNIYGGPYIGYLMQSQDEYVRIDIDHQSQWVRFMHDVDAGVHVGVELFVSKNFFFDLHVKKGFTSVGHNEVYVDYGDSYVVRDDSDLSSLKIVAGIGFQF